MPARTLQTSLLNWYRRARRDLPWRANPPDPYHVMLSEFMLQQTQVATVIPYFQRFLAKFPRLADLARADEQEVLRLWQGLGYYSRARNLHAAARRIVAEHDGRIPGDVETLLSLPGIGRYTAGAIASIAFDRAAPILDGNVARVICRLDGIRGDPRECKTNEWLWKRAEEILPGRHIGEFNSALMELGAMVCTPRNPKCDACPVRAYCRAFAMGLQAKIPPPRKARVTPVVKRRTFAIASRGRWLIEQRPAKGRWAGLWQFVTIDAAENSLKFPVEDVKRLGMIEHALTHRRYQFEVFTCRMVARQAEAGCWVTLKELERYPLPKPHVMIARMLAGNVESVA